jgi:hypothetical protein
MKTTIEVSGVEFRSVSISILSAGHGHKKVTVSGFEPSSGVNFSETFVTSDMPTIDAAQNEDDPEHDEAYTSLCVKGIEKYLERKSGRSEKPHFPILEAARESYKQSEK